MPTDLSALLDLVQWPAMVVTVLAAWLVGSRRKGRRNAGFWVFLASNVLWVVWGLHAHAWALISLQVALAILNIRGARKNDPDTGEPREDGAVRGAAGTAQPAQPG